MRTLSSVRQPYWHISQPTILRSSSNSHQLRTIWSLSGAVFGTQFNFLVHTLWWYNILSHWRQEIVFQKKISNSANGQMNNNCFSHMKPSPHPWISQLCIYYLELSGHKWEEQRSGRGQSNEPGGLTETFRSWVVLAELEPLKRDL